MPSQDNAHLRRQQSRWITENAARWVRPDAARFLAPGARLHDAFPALALKYNPNQPRVPAGNPDGGQWTDADGGWGDAQAQAAAAAASSNDRGGSSVRPRVIIDTTHLGGPSPAEVRQEVDALNLGLGPGDRQPRGVQLAGDPPPGIGDNGGGENSSGRPRVIINTSRLGTEDQQPARIGDNGGPPLDEPPEIPQNMPPAGKTMEFVRSAIGWLTKLGRYSPIADAFLGAAEQVDEIKN